MYTDYNRYQDDCLQLMELQLIQEFIGEVKRGKEATVLCCRSQWQNKQILVAVKIYKTGAFRNFQKKAGYMRGKVWDKRLLKRIPKIREGLWIETEYKILKQLHAIGVNVPMPYDLYRNMLIMEFVGNKGNPAPILKDLSLNPTQAKLLFEGLIDDLDRMLWQGVVHGDLSAYNILYHAGRAVIIDFPQAIDPASHMGAGQFFLRDIQNICEYFICQGVKYDAYALAREMWQQYYAPEF